jgi:hypothetical protein
VRSLQLLSDNQRRYQELLAAEFAVRQDLYSMPQRACVVYGT